MIEMFIAIIKFLTEPLFLFVYAVGIITGLLSRITRKN